MLKKAYSVETKLACIEMKKAGKSNKVIKRRWELNDSQIYTWMRWHKNEELHRFHPPVGKQDSYGKGLEELSEVEQLRLQVQLLKKYRNLVRQSTKQTLSSWWKNTRKSILCQLSWTVSASNTQLFTVGKQEAKNLRRETRL